MKLRENWKLQTSEKVSVTGESISAAGFNTEGWHGATLPTTVFGALVKDGTYKDVMFGMNIDQVDMEQFKKPFWFRTTFTLPDAEEATVVQLGLDGLIFYADIWLNGQLVADSSEIYGAYSRFKLDVTSQALKGAENTLAIKVYPWQPGDFSVGFVDWNPEPPDRLMGLWRDVTVYLSNDVSLKDLFVQPALNTQTLQEAELTIYCTATNHSGSEVAGTLEVAIDDTIKLQKAVTLSAHETKIITLTPAEFKELHIDQPRVWWTYDLGKPELYDVACKFVVNKQVSDASTARFGIRDVKDYLNEAGHRGLILNGRKVLIRGGGWVDQLFLDNNPDYVKDQLDYVKHMNMNTVRLEGVWGNDKTIYDLCDEMGLLLMVGWSCQWEWENYLGKPVDAMFGGIQTEEDMNLVERMWSDQVLWLRNHPSIVMWMLQSDLLPPPAMERRYIALMDRIDRTRPYVMAAKGWDSEVTGPTGVKMLGPYEWVPPVYWYEDTQRGGAFGFNTETGPGAQVGPLESVKRFIPEDQLWPTTSKVWDFHCGRNEFNTLKIYNEALFARYGKQDNIEDYCRAAQVLNYESIRPMFEAFGANHDHATGVIQWMLNASWPKLWWQLYDYWLMPNGAFYGTRKACEPLHAMYNYGGHKVQLVNKTATDVSSAKVQVKMLKLDMTEIFATQVTVSCLANQTVDVVDLPKQESNLVYFLDVRLLDAQGNVIGINQYWNTGQHDVVDYSSHEKDWYISYVKKYPDLSPIMKLDKVKITEQHRIVEREGRYEVSVDLENPTDKLAFFIEILIVGSQSGQSVLPVFLSDNYMSLLPGEKRTITGSFSKEDLGNQEPLVKVSGVNVE